MKPIKDQQPGPEEDIQEVYGPPSYFGMPDEEPEEVQMVYGPPNMFGSAPVLRGTLRDTPSTPEFEKLMRCYRSLRARTDFQPRIALVLGSGLGDFAEHSVDVVETVPYNELEDFPVSTVEGHKGRFIFGYIKGVPAVVMQGRVHYYEGYAMKDVVLPTRIMSMLGAEVLFLTNASGGINAGFSAGDFMVITDQVSCFVPNPLIGRNVDELGTRFPDMSSIYDPELRQQILDAASELDIKVQQGVYLQLTGPSFETPAEIRMLRGFGADAVGMSTCVEAIAARHAGMRVCGISCVSNLACGMTDQPLTHEEVQESANKAAPKFRALVTEAIAKIGSTL